MSTPLQVLLVEDSPADAELLQYRLEKSGFTPAIKRVTTADGLREALGQDGWQVVVLDWQLPRFGGLEAIQLVRASGRDLPIIIVSGVIGEEAAVMALKAGAHDFVRKDNLARLAPAIERELREARERAGRRQAEEAVRRHAERLRVLVEAGAAFAEATTDQPRLLARVSHMLGTQLGDQCTIRVLSEDGLSFVASEVYHPVPAVAAKIRAAMACSTLPAAESVTAVIASQSQPVVGSLDAAPEWLARFRPEFRLIAERDGLTDFMLVPLRARGRGLGMIALWRSGPEPRPYTLDDQRFALDLAERAALAVDNTRLYAHLEERVAERTAELGEAYSRLQELDRLKSNFVNSVSHELRSPLTSIMGYAEFLADEVVAPLTAEQRTFVLQIEKGSLRLQRLVDDLLDFARMDAGTFTLKLEPAELCGKAQEIVESLRPLVGEAKLALELGCEGPLHLMMDPARIGQVFLNLLTNAVKSTPPGGRVTLTILAVAGDTRVRCEVRDTGRGIAPEAMTRLFQRFSQIEGGHAGTGLGLSICKALVEAHGGMIGATSVVGEGSTFWFELPLGLPPGSAAPAS